MRQRIRNRSIAAGSVMRAERDALEKLARKWRDNALSTVPVDASDAVALVKARYQVIGLEEPNVVVVSSPLVMSVVAGAVTGILLAEHTGIRSMHDAQRFGVGLGDGVKPRALHQIMTALPMGETDRRSTGSEFPTLGEELVSAIDTARRMIPRFGHESWLPPGLLDWPAHAAGTETALADVTSLHDPDVLKRLHDEAAEAISLLAVSMQVRRDRRVEIQLRSHHRTFFQPTDMIAALLQNLGDAFDVSPQLLRSHCMCVPSQANYGNFSSSSAFFSDAMREVFGIQDSKTQERDAWQAYCLGAGICLPYEKFCVVSDRPARISVDESGRLHGDRGAAIEWRDGLRMHYWHGTFVPHRLEHVVCNPESLAIQDIEVEQNAEMRRMMLEIYGMKRYVADTGAHIIDELPGDHCIPGLRTACLLKKNMRNDESPLYFVDLLNSTPEPDGTYRRYLLRVDPGAYDGEAARNVHAAAASTWRNADGSLAFDNWLDYMPMIES